MKIFLLVGQSNMAGRGLLADVQPIRNARIRMFRGDQWLSAEEPLHDDKPDIAGVGLGMSFALDMLGLFPEEDIGLIPCAVGGTPLSRWLPGADLYQRAVTTAQAALDHQTLTGILWHQGEGDADDEALATTYGERLAAMMVQLRQDIPAPDVPVVVGELGRFLEMRESKSRYVKEVNAALNALPQQLPHCRCVSSEGLEHKGDELHFSAAALREFGHRYAKSFRELARRMP